MSGTKHFGIYGYWKVMKCDLGVALFRLAPHQTTASPISFPITARHQVFYFITQGLWTSL